MTTFEREGSVIKFTVDTGMNHTITTRFNCESELYAKLLLQQLNNHSWREIEAFAKKNYEEGFTDHKKRRPNRGWHPSTVK